MAFRVNSQIELSPFFGSCWQLSEYQKKQLKKTWAYDYAEKVFPKINEERFGVMYSQNQASRPNTPINILVSILFLKKLLNMTDEEMIQAVDFDYLMKYALHLNSCPGQVVTTRTISRFRQRLAQYMEETGIDLLKEENRALADVFCKEMNISGTFKRMDSIMIEANCKDMTRLELVYACIENLVKLLKKNGRDDMLDGFEDFLQKGNRNNVIYRCKPDQAKDSLKELIVRSMELYSRAKDDYGQEDACRSLLRMFNDQILWNGADTPENLSVWLASNKEIKATSLQNPSEPDATYRNKAGKGHTGYVGNFVEAVGEEGSIITDYDEQKNVYPDQKFCEDVINDMGKQEERVTLVADGAYFSADNLDKATANNIDLVSTALADKTPDGVISEFVSDNDKHIVTKCPAGNAPISCVYNEEKGQYTLRFTKACCESCRYKENCKAKLLKNKEEAVVKIHHNTLVKANYLKNHTREEYKHIQNARNGVEGIPSIMRRRYKIDKLPVRGLVRSKIWYSGIIGAINVKSYLKVLRKRRKKKIIRGLFRLRCTLSILSGQYAMAA